MKTQRKGFTLIELMVVIVIIGILAAIAIPKLFGMSAKAKASEVGPAAGTWSKMLQAYIVETSQLGGSAQIGYAPPGGNASTGTGTTSNFSYSVTSNAGSSSSVVWIASAVGALNECTSGSTWQITASIGTTGNSPNYAFSIGGSSVGAGSLATGPCGSLTPNFPRLQ